MFFLLPLFIRALCLGVMAMTVLLHLAPMIVLALVTHALINCDDATTIATAADDKTEKKPTEAKNKPSVVHTVSSAASVKIDEDKITVVFALPGLRSEDLEVKVLDDHVLQVSGTTKKGSHKFEVAEQIQLPALDIESMSATHEDGVLSVEFKRKIRRVTIPVKPLVKPALEPAPSTEEQQEEVWLAEWDTCLSDLAEMGFDDRASNRAALAKHSGSIKLAVKELRTKRVSA